jgi:hypothetical protein
MISFWVGKCEHSFEPQGCHHFVVSLMGNIFQFIHRSWMWTVSDEVKVSESQRPWRASANVIASHPNNATYDLLTIEWVWECS